jgi:hypothetical protein
MSADIVGQVDLNYVMPVAPAILRGAVVDSGLVEFGGRDGALRFLAPKPNTLLDRLPLSSPSRLSDLHELSTGDIISFLMDLGRALDFDRNEHLKRALMLTAHTAPTTTPILLHQYRRISSLFSEGELRDAVRSIGEAYLNGWVEDRSRPGSCRYIRAFGARAVHIVAGNSPVLGALTLIRNALTRSDAIIKAPSNDPFTSIAIARTMIDIAPNHPVTKHLSVAYWKGGDTEFEKRLYQPRNVDKIVAWGGMASVKHVTQYIQPGLELLSLDPKRSISFIGPEAFVDESTLDEVAVRLAADIGANNQEACSSSRIAFVASGTDEAGLLRVTDLGRRVYDALLRLPERTSTRPKHGIDHQLRSHIAAAALTDDWYQVFGGADDEGAIVVSKLPEPVDFAVTLANRVANLVPVDSLSDVLPRIDSYCQTVGLFPESLAITARDTLALAGVQRVVSLGYAVASPNGFGGPQDGLEPMRRLCKWITHDICDPALAAPNWR